MKIFNGPNDRAQLVILAAGVAAHGLLAGGFQTASADTRSELNARAFAIANDFVTKLEADFK